MLVLGITIKRIAHIGYLICSTVLLGSEIANMARKHRDDD